MTGLWKCSVLDSDSQADNAHLLAAKARVTVMCQCKTQVISIGGVVGLWIKHFAIINIHGVSAKVVIRFLSELLNMYNKAF